MGSIPRYPPVLRLPHQLGWDADAAIRNIIMVCTGVFLVANAAEPLRSRSGNLGLKECLVWFRSPLHLDCGFGSR